LMMMMMMMVVMMMMMMVVMMMVGYGLRARRRSSPVRAAPNRLRPYSGGVGKPLTFRRSAAPASPLGHPCAEARGHASMVVARDGGPQGEQVPIAMNGRTTLPRRSGESRWAPTLVMQRIGHVQWPATARCAIGAGNELSSGNGRVEVQTRRLLPAKATANSLGHREGVGRGGSRGGCSPSVQRGLRASGVDGSRVPSRGRKSSVTTSHTVPITRKAARQTKARNRDTLAFSEEAQRVSPM
jgi:hypothetical protein